MLLTLKSLADEPVEFFNKINKPNKNAFKSWFDKITFKKTPEVKQNVTISIVDSSIYYGGIKNSEDTDIITLIYDRDSLDSLYGLAFFQYIYEGRTQCIAYQQTKMGQTTVKPSKETIILGVDIACEDLLYINSFTNGIRIFGYRGTYNYLYDKPVQKLFNNVTFFQSDNDYHIGGKGVGKLENSVAMMLKILYFKGDDWSMWPLKRFAMSVAHANCFYENIPAYKLSKSVLEVKHGTGTEGVGKTTSFIHNKIDALMHDLKVKLEESLDKEGASMSLIKPEVKMSEYEVYRKRLQMHINRTRQEQGWVGKGLFNGEKYFAYCVPAVSFAVDDIISLSSINVDTTVCVEDLGDFVVYYIYSKTNGKAMNIAKIINEMKVWNKGEIVCTVVAKAPQHQRV